MLLRRPEAHREKVVLMFGATQKASSNSFFLVGRDERPTAIGANKTLGMGEIVPRLVYLSCHLKDEKSCQF
jgi:hypothetical protein